MILGTGCPPAISLDPITIVAISAAVAATTAVGVGVMNYEQSSAAAKSEKDLANQQRDQLTAEQQAAQAQEAAMANTGATFGWNDNGASSYAATGLGFGAKTAQAPNQTPSGRASLTGF